MILENSGKCCIHQRDNWHESIQHDRRTSGRFVVVHVDALQLEVGVTAVGTGGVDTVLIADNLSSEGEEGVRGRRDGDGKNRPWGRNDRFPYGGSVGNKGKVNAPPRIWHQFGCHIVRLGCAQSRFAWLRKGRIEEKRRREGGGRSQRACHGRHDDTEDGRQRMFSAFE